ncbi:MAG: thioesterase family protein [Myxococcales bacterium]|nr:thioesterase family protein [Myxococcales bacterium]
MGGAAFAEILRQVHTGDSPLEIQLPEGWGQGRSTFGGLVAALVVEAARQQVPPERRLRSALTTFVAPTTPGPVTLTLELLRSGRAVTQVRGDVRQDGKLTCAVMLAYGEARPSALLVGPEPRPEGPGPEGLFELPHLPGVTPDFVQHTGIRWNLGGPPYTGTPGPDMGGWCRYNPPSPPGSEAWVVAMMDFWPAPVLSQLTAPAPASSLTWSMELVEDVAGQPMDGWWYYRARTEGVADGYCQFRADLWAPDGRLAAVSRQTAAVFG